MASTPKLKPKRLRPNNEERQIAKPRRSKNDRRHVATPQLQVSRRPDQPVKASSRNNRLSSALKGLGGYPHGLHVGRDRGTLPPARRRSDRRRRGGCTRVSNR